MNAHPARIAFALILLVLAAAGCVTVPENDAVLVDARVAVSAARSNPQVVTYAPIELDQAVLTLRDADSLAARGGSIDDVHRLALLASQRASIAQETARTRSAEAALAAQRTAQVAQMQADVSRQQAAAAQLQAANAQRQAEEAQRQAAVTQLQAQSLQLSTAVAPPQLIDIPALPTSRGFVVTVDDGMFEPRSAQLLPSGSYMLQRVAAFLVAHPERGIAIESFSDTSDGYRDRDLSEQRAAVVQSTLISLGVDSRRMVVRAYGPAYPIASNATVSGRQLNRRVEIVVSDRPGVVLPRG